MAFPTIPTVGAGRVLTAVQANTTATRTFPSLTGLTKNAGDLLVAIVIAYQTGTGTDAAFSGWTGSFTEVFDSATTTTMAIGIATKVSDGTETGTFAVTQANVTGHACFILMSIPDGVAAEAGGRNSSTNATQANPSSFSPSWGSADTLWIAVGGDGEDATAGSYTGVTASPTNYSGDVVTAISQDAIGGVNGLVGFRQNAASSEDAGAFTADTSNARHAGLIIAIQPKQDATASPSAIARSFTLPAVTASPRNATATPNAIARSFTIPAPFVDAGFPQIRSSTSEGGTDLSAGVSPALPDGAAAGDLVLYYVSHDDENIPSLVGSGWTVVLSESYPAQMSAALFARVLDGTTGDNLISIDGVTANDYTIQGVAITSHAYDASSDLTLIPYAVAEAQDVSSTSFSVNPPVLPTGSTKTWLWFAFASVQKRGTTDSFNIASVPGSFTTVNSVSSDASSTGIHSALFYRKNRNNAMDAGPVSGIGPSATRTSIAMTVAILPVASALTSPGVIHTSATAHAPTLSASSTVEPSVASAPVSMPEAIVSAGGTLTSPVVVTSVSVPAPTASASGTRSPAVISRAFTIPLSVGTGSPVPRFIGAGTPNSSTGDLGIPLPSNIVTGDLLTLHIESYNTAVSLQPGPEWIPIDGADGLSSAVNVAENSVFYTFYDENDPPSTVIPDSGDHTACVVLAWRDVNPTNPIHVYLESTDATSGSTQVATGVTTTIPNAMIVVSWSVSTQTSTANMSGGTPSSYAEAADYAHTLGNDGTLIVGYGVRSTAGATGNITALTTTAGSAAWVFALAPLPVDGTATPSPIQQSFGVHDVAATGGTGGSGDDTATPAVIGAVATLPAPTASVSATASPAAITVAVTTPAPTVTASATPQPAAIARSFTIGAPSATAGSSVTPAVISRSFVMPAVAASASAATAPAVVITTVAVGAPTATASSSTSPAVITSLVALGAPTVTAGSSVTPNVVAIQILVNAPTASVGVMASPGVIAIAATPQAVVVRADGTVAPSSIARSFAIGAPVAQAGSSVTPSAITRVFAAGAPTVTAGSSVSPSVIARAVTMPLVSASGGTGATTSPNVVSTVVVTPPVSASAGSSVSLAVVARSFAVLAPTATASSSVVPAAISRSFLVNAPTLSAGHVVSAGVIARAFTMPLVSASGGSADTAAPGVIGTVVAVGAVTATAGSFVAAGVVARSFAVAAPSVSAGSSASLGVIARLFALGAPTVSAASSVSLAAIPTSTTTPPASVTAGSSSSPGVVLLTLTMPPVAADGSEAGDASPTAIVTTITMPPSVETAGSSVTASVVSRAFLVNAPTASVSKSATPGRIITAVAIGAPATIASSAAAVQRIITNTSLGQASPIATSTVFASGIALSVSIHQATGSGSSTAHPLVVIVDAEVIDPAVIAHSSALVAQIALQAVLWPPEASSVTEQDDIATPSAITVTVTLPNVVAAVYGPVEVTFATVFVGSDPAMATYQERTPWAMDSDSVVTGSDASDLFTGTDGSTTGV